jgi:hypothetical protein
VNLTGSALPRAAVCPGSVVLPHADVQRDDSDAGLENHGLLEAVVNEGRLDDLPPEVRALILPGSLVSAEIAVAYNIRTDSARILGYGINREYNVTEDEIAGTIDLQVILDGDRAVVVDYKRWLDVGLPDQNEQTMFYGLATSRLFGIFNITLVVAYVKQDPDGKVVLSRPLVIRTVDELEIEAFVVRLRWIVAQVDLQRGKAIPDVRESKHCRWCSAAAHCPSKRELIRALVVGIESGEDGVIAPLNRETAALAWERVGYGRAMLDRIEEALTSFSKENPFTLSNGMVVGEHMAKGREMMDVDMLHAVVAELHGQEIADRVVKKAATKEWLGEVLRAAKVPRHTAAKETVLIELRKRGGTKRDPKIVVGEYRPMEDE